MGKLILHIATAALLVALGRRLDWAWWVTTGAVVLGAVAVHVVFERFYSGSRHLGAAAVSNDDPLMITAFEDARRTWPQFLTLYPTHPKDSLVKFRLTTKTGDIENVWGDLLELETATAKVYLRTPPVGSVDIPSREMSIPVADIVDWQIMEPDGSLRGGFTQQATFRIIERENGPLSAKFAEQLSRYRPL